jgi:DAK2 domain fusion protein YloV
VDAGGQGLYTILEGALHYLKGEVEQIQFRKPQIIVSDIPSAGLPEISAVEEVPYGYCTEFLLKGFELDPDRIRTKLVKKGESLIVVGDTSTVRVHIHTLDPGNVIHYATSLGNVHNVSIRNMDEQHQDYVEMRRERLPAMEVAILAVVSGDGLAEVFKSLGAAAIVPGGQTMNPSTKDILQAVETVPSNKIIILPNNKNVVMTAEQVQSLTQKSIRVIPTKTVPQGVSSLLAFDYEANFQTNTRLMDRAISTVNSIEITRAVRSTQIGGFKIKRKDAIGLLDGELVEHGSSPLEVLKRTLDKVNLDKAEVVTVYYGADTEPAEAEKVGGHIREEHPQLQIEVVRGGQPHYNYIVSVE